MNSAGWLQRHMREWERERFNEMPAVSKAGLWPSQVVPNNNQQCVLQSIYNLKKSMK
jgi:hypothetical protein